jgi:N-acyl-D-aspartate/D-glutamate deacylase
MTRLDSAVFNEGWQQSSGVSYDALQWVLTGERLNKETFEKYRKQGGYVVIHSIPEEMVRAALAAPGVMMASDSLLEEGKGHPRAAGNFSRVLARYVREQNALSLMDAIGKMTLLPARRIETVVPEMKNKGRIREGADADIAVFDPARVQDKATFDKPAQYSEGIPYVLVGGQFVVKNNELQNALPGKPVRARVSGR